MRRTLNLLAGLPQDQFVTVMVKLRLRGSVFSMLPVSNDPGNARSIAFKEIVADLLWQAVADAPLRVLQFAANVGAFVVLGRACHVKRLLMLPEIEAADVIRIEGVPRR